MLQQYVWLATASQEFEPGAVRPPTQSYQAFVKPYLKATRLPRAARKVLAPVVRQVKRSDLGRRVLAQVRRRVDARKGASA